METASKVIRTDCLVNRLGADELEIVSYETRLPAGTVAGPHRHAYSTMARVLEGTFQFRIGDGPAKDYTVGEVFSEPAGEVVSGRALTETTLYVVLVRAPGTPEARPA
jgi:quercetin dioxygenase-like cupin family protein